MNKKLFVIPIVIVSVFLVLISVSENSDQQKNSENIEPKKIISEDLTDNQIIKEKTLEEVSLEIKEKYSDIEKNKTEFQQTERIWQQSGPFKIDREKYRLGEKIFMIAENIKFDEKGEIVLLRPLNSTHSYVYDRYLFDGSEKGAFNIYFDPKFSESRKICSKGDLIGDWEIMFSNTNYEDLKFEIIDATIPSEEEKWSKIIC